jgi:hypothetical protein
VSDDGRAFGTCQHCGRLKRLRTDGRVAVHYLRIDVSRRAVVTVGAARVHRRCSGSGRPPRPERA